MHPGAPPWHQQIPTRAVEIDGETFYFPRWVGVVPLNPDPTVLADLSDSETVQFEGDFQWDYSSEWSEDEFP